MTGVDLEKYADLIVNTVSRFPFAAAVSTACLVGATWTIRDFQQWKAFGTGGTPPTWKGYLRMSRLRIGQLVSSDNLCDATPLSADGPRYLRSPLPTRPGRRPQIISWTMPQRQKPEPVDPLVGGRLHSLMRAVQAQHADLLTLSPSKTEGRTIDAIYAKPDLPTLNPLAKDRILDHEIAHAHTADNSLHVWLSDPDARTVIEAGWGQRFPLKFVKSGWIMVYAPRDNAEVDVVEQIVMAGVGWMTGTAV